MTVGRRIFRIAAPTTFTFKETSTVTPSRRRISLRIVTLALMLVAAGLLPAAAHAAPAPAWDVSLTSAPTHLKPGGSHEAPDNATYYFEAVNVGGAATSGPVTFTDTLPAGITPISTEGRGSCTVGAPTVQDVVCTTSEVVEPGDFSLIVRISVDVDPGFADPSTVVNEATISGGGAATVTASTTTTISSIPAAFDFLDGANGLQGQLTKSDGSAATEAGSHPGQLTVDLAFPANSANPETDFGAYSGADGGLRDVLTSLPPGVIVNPTATPVRCNEAQLESQAGGIGCPDSSQVGLADIETVAFVTSTVQGPIYNVVPPPGKAAAFAFDPTGLGIYSHVFGGVRAGDYSLSASSNDILARFSNPVLGIRAHFWGDPSSSIHDSTRGKCDFSGGGLCPVAPQAVPLVSVPTACADSLTMEASADSWGTPGTFKFRAALFSDSLENPTPVTDCHLAAFAPTLQARPTTNVADSPSGLSVDLHVPQTNSFNALATAHLRKAVVKLPPGLSLNPSSANGLEGCSSAQIGIDPSTGVADGNQPTCPDASRVGDVEVDTPLLPNALPGSVYVAKPYDNPFDSLLAIYIVVNDPQTGVLIKLAGHVEADSSTGQLTTTFDDNPQLPFEDFKLDFFSGPGAVLRTPSVCGTYSTTSSLTPWSAPESGPPATPSDSYGITANCSSSAGAQPNKPEFEAGTVSPIAGKYTPFVVHLKREDGSQQFKTLTLNPPPGLTAKLAGTPACSEAALASAASKSGRDEQQSPSCPSSSQIGTVSVGAGAGPAPYYAKGTAYLGGPYKGAPLSMAIITPAVAGPYDLGTVVTRVALHVNPATAQITADADPVPSILQGIPLDVRSIDVALDKPGFSRTGTSCDPFAVTGNLISTLGQSAALESRYQLGNCANLAFKPKLSIKLKGATKRGKNPALIANLSAKDGEANIASTAVTLPRSAFLDQSHIKTVCTRVQFAAGAGNGAECPQGSIYGTATAKSPLLDYTLSGNAYLRSSNHKLPDLVIALQGPPSQPIAIELDGRTDSVKGALRNTFEAVPDAPVSSFRLELFGGKRGLVVNSRSLCAATYRANVVFGAQNGAQLTAKPKVRAQCPKAKRKKHKRHGR
jgi:uncharacterized repeat protein (TIGR01451 family)